MSASYFSKSALIQSTVMSVLFTAGQTAYRICSEVLMDYIVHLVFF